MIKRISHMPPGTRYLGFGRTGPKIDPSLKYAINGLLRQNELELELELDGRVLRRRNPRRHAVKVVGQRGIKGDVLWRCDSASNDRNKEDP